ncbi:hypothetical protein J8273_7238 [Carpediemonas membranifera]|uniref:Uncharacterized protein n=1 Tax=Carpediemonas membranifera TaxID=201153 RepID=A0A8J6AS64_9EUKA|nr:hypothetical protein J8273_7238 [Carpediemonas membranifera]|eukprot:KAG9390965.1 hypothetical protein J8273_7238 [Carpediemonas membranifera]
MVLALALSPRSLSSHSPQPLSVSSGRAVPMTELSPEAALLSARFTRNDKESRKTRQITYVDMNDIKRRRKKDLEARGEDTPSEPNDTPPHDEAGSPATEEKSEEQKKPPTPAFMEYVTLDEAGGFRVTKGARSALLTPRQKKRQTLVMSEWTEEEPEPPFRGQSPGRTQSRLTRPVIQGRSEPVPTPRTAPVVMRAVNSSRRPSMTPRPTPRTQSLRATPCCVMPPSSMPLASVPLATVGSATRPRERMAATLPSPRFSDRPGTPAPLIRTPAMLPRPVSAAPPSRHRKNAGWDHAPKVRVDSPHLGDIRYDSRPRARALPQTRATTKTRPFVLRTALLAEERKGNTR